MLASLRGTDVGHFGLSVIKPSNGEVVCYCPFPCGVMSS